MFHWDLVNFVLYQEFSGHVFFIFNNLIWKIERKQQLPTIYPFLKYFPWFSFVMCFHFSPFHLFRIDFGFGERIFTAVGKAEAARQKLSLYYIFLLYFLLLNIHRILLLKRDPWMWICFYQTLSFSLYLSLLNLSRKTTDKVVLIQRGIVHSLSLMKN